MLLAHPALADLTLLEKPGARNTLLASHGVGTASAADIQGTVQALVVARETSPREYGIYTSHLGAPSAARIAILEGAASALGLTQNEAPRGFWAQALSGATHLVNQHYLQTGER